MSRRFDYEDRHGCDYYDNEDPIDVIEPKEYDCWTEHALFCLRTTKNEQEAEEKFINRMSVEGWSREEIDESWIDFLSGLK